MEKEENRMEENELLHDKAWDLLGEKGLTLGEKMMVRSNFVTAMGYKNEHPNISKKVNSDGSAVFKSTHSMIESFIFEYEHEVILANAVYLSMDVTCTIDDFKQHYRYVCRVIGMKSSWA